MDTSAAVRTLIAEAAAQRHREAENAGITRQVRREAASAQAAENRVLTKAARTIGRHVHRNGPDPEHICGRRCAQQAMSSKQRQEVTVDEALALAIDRRWIASSGDHYVPGGSYPA